MSIKRVCSLRIILAPLQLSGWYISLSWYPVIFQLACVVSFNELWLSEEMQRAAEAVSEQTITQGQLEALLLNVTCTRDTYRLGHSVVSPAHRKRQKQRLQVHQQTRLQHSK